ncbi:MAG: leucine--tRNA ligase [Crocinitomicaceae bacterium]|nr:leucine--tRNA ligase [Crocinitomicaceae bacterium]|tara:strand:- start:24796 stop:27375 length:2580 start_codon:yes stop_codon:yes gene_type:complete
MKDYDFEAIESKWRERWKANGTYRTEEVSEKEKLYVLDMFPYPSGAGLHVGHPLGYIASDIYSRYKKLNGYNVLHPMGYDSFGLPAEQYAIQTGQHPAITTEQNINRYREQLDLIGFSYDWSRQVKTSDPSYYKWTQWIFLKLFDSWYNNTTDKAEKIETLVAEFEKNGNQEVEAVNACEEIFDASTWKGFNEKKQQEILLDYRLTYISNSVVNWCPELGTVLANDEVKDGVSERGGYPVEQREMRQWSMRIGAYSERLLQGLETLDWTDSLKEIQRNWIGKSVGASVHFDIDGNENQLEIFTTRPDTIFGATFMVLAPEHELVNELTSTDQKEEVEQYIIRTKTRTERDRLSDVKTVSGAFTGSYAIHPFTGEKIPIWIADYVLAGYGTGAVMAVPSGDQRDWDFANHFGLEIPAVIEGTDVSQGANDDKTGVLINSSFLDGLKVKDAIKRILFEIEKKGIGERQTNYKMRDAVFSRQRYWGEPVPMYFKDGVPYPVAEKDLPVILPEVDKYLPTEDGEPPLGRAENWAYQPEGDSNSYPLELNTMPGWAGSSWYFMRYMDPDNTDEFVSKDKLNYWKNVDVYLGGAEHATGHLLYFRFWTKVLHDLGYVSFDEPAKKLINQGMILAEDGQKMSKRYGNVVNPDDIIKSFGADSLRLHEMFLGPIEQHKPWNTKGIEGVHRFLKKYWRMVHNSNNEFSVTEETPTKEEYKALHKAIKKVGEDNNRFSFNTSVSTFMVAVNELIDLKCNKREIIEGLTILLNPHCPYITEEIWEKLGHSDSIVNTQWPEFNEEYLIESNFSYPVSFNGKMRFKLELPLALSKEEVENKVLGNEQSAKYLEGKSPKKVIVVPGRIVNVVV